MNSKHRMMVMAFLICACIPAVAQSATGAPEVPWLRGPDFWVATAANTAGFALFVSRVHFPAATNVFGYATQAIGVPAAIFGISDLVSNQTDFTTVGLLSYAAWAIGAAVVDHVLRVNYRDPVRPGVLVPYVVTYYLGIGVLSASQLLNGIVPWVIAGGTCLLAVAASFYARAHGAD